MRARKSFLTSENGAGVWEYALGIAVIGILVLAPFVGEQSASRKFAVNVADQAFGLSDNTGGVGFTDGPTSIQDQYGSDAVAGLDFSEAADAIVNWAVHYYAPQRWESFLVDNEKALRINIDESGPTNACACNNQYQGKSYYGPGESPAPPYMNLPDGSSASFRLYVDPAWESDGRNQETGVTLVMGDESGTVRAYPKIEYRDSDATGTSASFRVYTAGSGWIEVGMPAGFSAVTGGWLTVEFEFSGGSAYIWRIDGDTMHSDLGASSDGASRLQYITLDSVNFGQDQDYYYDDIVFRDGSLGGGS
jgi:hypothetical protein